MNSLKEIMAAADEYAAEAFALGVVGKTSENKTMAAKRSELESKVNQLLDALIVATGTQDF